MDLYLDQGQAREENTPKSSHVQLADLLTKALDGSHSQFIYDKQNKYDIYALT